MVLDSQRLGEALVAAGAITEEDLAEALRLQETRHDPLGAILLSLGVLTRDTLDEILADHFGVPFVDLRSYTLDPQARELLPLSLVRKHRVIPLFRSGNALMLVMSNPNDIVALDEIRQATGGEIDVSYAFDEEIEEALRRLYGSTDDANSEVVTLAERCLAARRSRGADTMEGSAESGPLVELVQRMIDIAAARGASDIHIEPHENELHWRIRVDGVLESGPPLPKELHPAVISRVKILADLDISETRHPQDGHFSHFLDGKRIDVRVSVIPMVVGENAVLRLIDRSRSVAHLRDLGLSETARLKVEEMVAKPHGLVLVTGPTGSGKTTLLYALLARVASSIRHVITIEDPVETLLESVRQIQVNPKAGLTFEDGLRAILRHDPDVIMVGEIRDRASADIAVRAALTGHLLLSSLHTNDAASAVARILDLGTDPFLLATSLRGVVAQRLVRVLCKECRRARALDGENARRLGLASPITVYQAQGCSACHGKGYAGRTGVFEVMVVGDAIAEVIAQRRSTDEIRELALRDGMRPLREEGLALAAAGITSVEEVLRST
ncbi:MAG: GspE/PulE family protein [Planctomycetota bacterium]